MTDDMQGRGFKGGAGPLTIITLILNSTAPPASPVDTCPAQVQPITFPGTCHG